MKRIKQFTAAVLTAVLVVTLAGGCQPRDPALEQARFEEFIAEDFRQTIESSGYLIMHQFFEHPENYGIDPANVPVELMDTDQDIMQVLGKAKENTETGLSLRDFDRSLLTPEQQEMYDIYEHQQNLEEKSQQEKFLYLYNMWSNDSGIHTQIPEAFLHIRILNEQDVQNTLQIMRTIPETFEWALEYAREQEKRGLLQLQFDSVLEYCQKQVDAGMQGGTFPVLRDRINQLGFDDATTKKYQDELVQTFQKDYLGAYKTIIEQLSEFQKHAKTHTGSLAQLENGKEYYEQVLLPEYTGNGRSAQETIDLLEKWIRQSVQDIRRIAQANPDLFYQFMDITTDYTDYPSILNALQTAYQADFPKITMPAYQVQDIPEEQRVDTILAYYLFNAVDASTPDQIRVNPTSEPNTGSIYTTIAHEGVPGHMYQYHYVQEQKPLWHTLQNSSYLGYTEGYCRYAELVSLDYLDHISEPEKDLYRALLINDNAFTARLDIGIHCEGWDLKAMQDYLQQWGIDPSTANVFYDSLCSMSPGIVTSYGVGLIEMLELRGLAETELGDSFTKLGFHEAVLSSGAAPFSVVRENVREYIAGVKNPSRAAA